MTAASAEHFGCHCGKQIADAENIGRDDVTDCVSVKVIHLRRAVDSRTRDRHIALTQRVFQLANARVERCKLSDVGRAAVSLATVRYDFILYLHQLVSPSGNQADSSATPGQVNR